MSSALAILVFVLIIAVIGLYIDVEELKRRKK